MKRLLGAGKAGHVGSLDPLATGMLPICLGEATKIAGEIVGGRKRYAFDLALGKRTDTGDREGAVVETGPAPGKLDGATVERALERFRGSIMQVPPMYSALKRDGQRLYRLARAGVEVERAPRPVQIDALSLIAARGDVLALEALCSKGTYIRVLGEDIARALGTCGHVTRLRRLSVAPFEREPMLALEELEALCRAGMRPALIPSDRALPDLPALVVAADAARRLLQGQTVALPLGRDASARQTPASSCRVRLYEDRGAFLGLGELIAGTVRPKRMFLVGEGGSE